MHTFRHEPSGVTITYNSDFSGETHMTVPVRINDDGSETFLAFDPVDIKGQIVRYEITGIPAAALAAFSKRATIAKVKDKLEQI